MPLPVGSIICVLVTAVAATGMDLHPLMRREERARRSGHAGVVSARGHFFPNSVLESGPASYKFHLKSITHGECLQLDDETFSTQTCNSTEPKQEFTAEGISGPGAGAVATSITTYNDKLFCWSGNQGVEAQDTCDADKKKFKLAPAGVQCFRVKLFLNDRCLTQTMQASAASCDIEASQWTAETDQDSCPAVVETTEDDGLQGGGTEGGEGGEAQGPQGGESGAIDAGAGATSTVGPSTSPNADGTAQPTTLAPGTEEGGTVAPGTVEGQRNNETLSTTPELTVPPTTTTINGYRFMLKSVKLGECLRVDGMTFQVAECDAQDPQQQFIAHGFLNPGDDVIAYNISMYNGKVLCFDGSDKVEAYDDSCVDDFANVELEPIAQGSACFKVKWNQNTQIPQARCLAPPNNDQDMMATQQLCAAAGDDAHWTADTTVRACV